MLLAGRADPDASGEEGETPLIRASRRGHACVVEVGSHAFARASCLFTARHDPSQAALARYVAGQLILQQASQRPLLPGVHCTADLCLQHR